MAEDTERSPGPARRLSRDLLDAEGMVPDDAGSSAEACIAVLDGLHRKLRPIVGSGGFESLLGRATILGARRYPALGSFTVPRTGPLSGDDLRRVLEEAEEGSSRPAELLVAELLAFAGYLMGWRFLMPMLRDLWPEAAARHDVDELTAEPRGHTARDMPEAEPRSDDTDDRTSTDATTGTEGD